MTMVPILIAFGANLGEPLERFQAAIQLLFGEMQFTAISQPVQSAPMYNLAQPSFINAVASAQTKLGPLSLLRLLKQTETDLGRQARHRNGPRELDLDLLSYGALIYKGPYLQVPHPRLPERRFVLVSIAEIAPELVIPGYSPISQLLSATQGQSASVQVIKNAALSIPGPR